MSAEKSLGKVGRMAWDFLTAPGDADELGDAALHALSRATGSRVSLDQAKIDAFKDMARAIADQAVPPEFRNDPGAQEPVEDEDDATFDAGDADAIDTTGEAV